MFSATRDARALKLAAIPHPTHRSTGPSLFPFPEEEAAPLNRQDMANGIELFARYRVTPWATFAVNRRTGGMTKMKKPNAIRISATNRALRRFRLPKHHRYQIQTAKP